MPPNRQAFFRCCWRIGERPLWLCRAQGALWPTGYRPAALRRGSKSAALRRHRERLPQANHAYRFAGPAGGGDAQHAGHCGTTGGAPVCQPCRVERIAQWERRLTRRAEEGLARLPGVEVFADKTGQGQTGVLSFCVKGMDCEQVGEELARRQIAPCGQGCTVRPWLIALPEHWNREPYASAHRFSIRRDRSTSFCGK